jgi:hypothetical protein
MEKTPAAGRFVGIDLSKSWVDVHVRPDGIAFRYESEAQGSVELVQRLRRIDPRLIVLEASGGYERLPAVISAAPERRSARRTGHAALSADPGRVMSKARLLLTQCVLRI